MNHVFFRALLVSVPRFLLLMGFLAGLQWVEWSPLPAWTGVVLAYALHFSLTYLAARWVFARHSPTSHDVWATAIILVAMELLLEGLALMLFMRADLSDVLRQYGWVSLVIIAMYVLATVGAAARATRVHVKQVMPEGLEG